MPKIYIKKENKNKEEILRKKGKMLTLKIINNKQKMKKIKK